ncbi:helix-turn-helix transcriptional regulator [Hathewaya histolytica]|uniref:DNA-binding phage protein n=1 Tax=Hathewaya histolytica TaxID=1498 RepID=A0A4U9R9Y9_HATHI|nr:helix-turn-helix transcriptional regulator [Hathewaya histolytica]VTQ88364.1 DNA-binding phage protein [Hathewaya histolytica]
MSQKINIKLFREKQKLSQNKLAKKSGISQSYLSALERNEKSPTVRILGRIADELNICPKLMIKCSIECKNCNKKCKCTCGGNE